MQPWGAMAYFRASQWVIELVMICWSDWGSVKILLPRSNQ
jgi:hypothetical protein